MLTFILYSSKYSVTQVTEHDSFFRFILLLSGDINVNPGPTTENNDEISLSTVSFYNCDEPNIPSECDSSDCNKEHNNSKWNILFFHILRLNINILLPKID